MLQALFMTDNSSVDAAASWVLDNQHLPDIDEPFKVLYSFTDGVFHSLS